MDLGNCPTCGSTICLAQTRRPPAKRAATRSQAPASRWPRLGRV